MYNRVIVMGRLTGDPELKQTPNGVSVTSFSIAVDRRYSGKGEKQTDFLEIVAWRQTAEFICRYFSKGSPILIEGSIQTRQFTDKQGNNRRVWEVVAGNAAFTESKQKASSDAHVPGVANGAEDFSEPDDPDDGSLPF